MSTAREEASLGYEIQSRQSAFDATLSYSNLDIQDSVFLDELTGEDVVADNGRRELLSFSTGLKLGREAPVSFEIRQSRSESSFTDTTDPGLLDSRSQRLDAGLSLALTPTLTLQTTAAYSDFREDGPDADRLTSRRAGLGMSYQLSPALALSAGVNYSISETEDPADDSEGLGYDLGLSLTRPAGAITLALSAVETVNGTRSQFSFGRSLDFAWGQASLSLGVSETGDSGLQPLVNGRLAYALGEVSALDLSLSQAALTGTDNEEVIRTELSVGYSRQISERNRLRGSFQLSDRNVLGDPLEDQTVMRLDLSYAHGLGQDWSLVSGYQYSRVDEQVEEDRKDSTLFLRLERTFAFRP